MAALAVLSVIFAILWIRGIHRPPLVQKVVVEKIREVPVEKIKEVPVVHVKQIEVPAQLTDDQQKMIDFATRMLSRPEVATKAGVLYKIPAFRLKVIVARDVQDFVPEAAVRKEMEAVLEKNKIKADGDAPYGLVMAVDAFWDEGKNILTYLLSLDVYDQVILERDQDFRSAGVFIYQNNTYGRTDKFTADADLRRFVGENVQNFANDYQSAQQKEVQTAKRGTNE